MPDTTLNDWLLQASTPTIRYLTLRSLLDLPESNHTVRKARQAMQTEGPIPAILAQQTETGAWLGDRSFYTPKFTSTHWSMLLLAELDADPTDPRLQLGARFMLDADVKRVMHWVDGETRGLSCFWGNLLRYVVHSGLQDDPRLENVIGTLTRDGKNGWRCKYNEDEPCAWGAGRALWAFAGLPLALKTPAVQAAIQSACSLLLDEYDLLKADYPTRSRGKTSILWPRLSFPLFYQADRLLVLRTLAELDLLGRPGVQPALDWLASIRSRDGRWTGASPFRQRTWLSLGDSQETQRWISLQSALVLKSAHRE